MNHDEELNKFLAALFEEKARNARDREALDAEVAELELEVTELECAYQTAVEDLGEAHRELDMLEARLVEYERRLTAAGLLGENHDA